jgi:hypothetical protein
MTASSECLIFVAFHEECLIIAWLRASLVLAKVSLAVISYARAISLSIRVSRNEALLIQQYDHCCFSANTSHADSIMRQLADTSNQWNQRAAVLAVKAHMNVIAMQYDSI